MSTARSYGNDALGRPPIASNTPSGVGLDTDTVAPVQCLVPAQECDVVTWAVIVEEPNMTGAAKNRDCPVLLFTCHSPAEPTACTRALATDTTALPHHPIHERGAPVRLILAWPPITLPRRAREVIFQDTGVVGSTWNFCNTTRQFLLGNFHPITHNASSHFILCPAGGLAIVSTNTDRHWRFVGPHERCSRQQRCVLQAC